MRAPAPSEPYSTFPTYQVPQVSAMRGSAPPVQVANNRADDGGYRAEPLDGAHHVAVVAAVPLQLVNCDDVDDDGFVSSVITGSSCRRRSTTTNTSLKSTGNSNLKMQSVTTDDNYCLLLNTVTVPNKEQQQQRNKDRATVTHNNNNINNSSKLNDDDNADATTTQTTSILQQSPPPTYYNDKTYTLDVLIKLSQRTRELERNGYDLSMLRLCGGGESSLSTGTTGWGTPPSQQTNNNTGTSTSGWGTANPANPNSTGTQNWNSNANRSQNSSQGPTPQDANKSNSNGPSTGQQQPATTSQSNTGWGQPGGAKVQAGGSPSTATAPTTAAAAAAAAANTQQGSSGQQGTSSTSTKQQLEQLNNMREAIFSQDGWGGHVNQDTNWDIPGSPEPTNKPDGSGGPPQWKPTVNNGTELWEANLRNGGQPPPQPQQKTPWGHTPSTNIGGTWGEDDDTADSSNVWTGVPNNPQWGPGANNGNMWVQKKEEWGPPGNSAGWGDPRSADPRASMDPREMRSDPRDIRAGSADPMRLLDPREQMRLVGGDMRGDPRGITGRLNGAGAEFWGQGGPHAAAAAAAHNMHHQSKMPVGPGGNNNTGWEEPSPPAARRSTVVPNYDDGTSLWGTPSQPQRMGGASMGRGGGGGVTGPPAMGQSRLKQDGAGGGGGGGGGGVWSHGRNGSWDETGPTGWDDATPWPKQKTMGTPIWDDMDWSNKHGPKPPLTKEMVWNSKQFRQLVDMGYKKEDVENALRHREMNLEEALDMLSLSRPGNMDGCGWPRRHEDHYEHQQFPGQRFPSGPSTQLSFPPGGNPPSLLNNMNSASGGANNMSPAAMVQKLLPQTGASQGFGTVSATGARGLQPQPSTQQLRMLVQQIQMAVQAGYLNHQILNQPLAPQTLVLLNQLLQQIKNLQQLANQQNLAQQCMNNGKHNNNAILQCSVMITKAKQQITNLQNQIAAQQAIYVKQQQHQGGLGGGPSDLFKTNLMHDTINSIQSNFADLGIKDPQFSQSQQQQSRLNQWKLPAPDKEETGDFSRAPGSASKPLATSPNMNPLGLTQPDGPWASGRSGDTGWPDSNTADNAPDGKDSQWPTPAQPSLTDLVPEFEPGKPWKGNQLKSIEDDPSITPGSVVRSPLSIATIKDTELFNMNPSKSPPPGDSIQPLSLSSSTWSFNPPSSTSSAFTSPQSKLPTTKALGDLNPGTAVTSELWAAPKSRGPPPGLSAKTGSLINGWTTNLGATSAAWGAQRSSGNWGSSSWLLLRNLTAQIDGSTLRTLCMQHGPLQSFHLFLHQGFALVKYSSREEATKAQATLNNCVLGNTTILAENPNEWETNAILQQMSTNQPQGGTSGAWRGATTTPKQPGGGNGGGDTWSTGWAGNASAASLWGTSPLDSGDQARATPSSLNSFLPGDLLGGESM